MLVSSGTCAPHGDPTATRLRALAVPAGELALAWREQGSQLKSTSGSQGHGRQS